MKVKFALLLPLFAALFFACEKDPETSNPTPAKYQKGIFVLNEGTFGGTGDITYVNLDSNKVVQNVFQLENDGATLGQFPQSLTFYDGKAYICASDANRLYILNQNTFKVEAFIAGFSKPRYFLPIDARFALVSQWGNSGVDGKVLKIDLLENKILDSVKVGNGPEKLFRIDYQSVMVPNVGGFSEDSTISWLNWQTMKVEKTIVTGGKNPCCLIKPNFGGKPYLLCQGVFSTPNSGWVGGFDSPTSAGNSIPNHFSNDLALDQSGNAFYFSAGGGIFQKDGSGLKKLFDFDAYALAVDPNSGNLLCTDAKGFSGKGVLKIFTNSGDEKGSFETGVAPGEIVVKN